MNQPPSHPFLIENTFSLLSRFLGYCSALALVATLHAAPVRIAPGADIQAALNHGDAVLLQPASP